MNFHILSQKEATEFHSDWPYVFISICDPVIHRDQIPAKHLAYQLSQRKLKDILRLFFWDVDINMVERIDDIDSRYHDGIFNQNQAHHILTFFEHWKDKVDTFCVHCRAGVSRSSGVVSALEIILNGKGADSWIFEPQQRYIPNLYVRDMIIQVAQSRSIY